MVRLTDRPDMTLDVYRVHKTTIQQHQGTKVKHFDVSNMIYHKFSHGAISYTLNGENVIVMLESSIFVAVPVENICVYNLYCAMFCSSKSILYRSSKYNLYIDLRVKCVQKFCLSDLAKLALLLDERHSYT